MQSAVWRATLGGLLLELESAGLPAMSGAWGEAQADARRTPAPALAQRLVGRMMAGPQTGGAQALTVFTHLNGEHPGWAPPGGPDEFLPQPAGQAQPADVRAALGRLAQALEGTEPVQENLPGVLALLEEHTGRLPAAPGAPDVPLYDRLKLTAALAACLACAGDAPAQDGLEDAPLFLLYSADFSGIQKFIYTVATEGALRSLRSRSFFLDLLMEHFVDETLAAAGVSRANLLYSGGGHCYLLLPATEAVCGTLRRLDGRWNGWLAQQFGVQLYLAQGWTACTANDLANVPAEKAPYKAMFRRVSGEIACSKLHRYDADGLRRLNRQADAGSARECRICGRADQLEGDRCRWCARLTAFSARILDAKRRVFLVSRAAQGGDLTLPAPEGEYALTAVDEAEALARLKAGEDIVRIYTKNAAVASLPGAVRLHVGEYAADTQMQALAQSAQGIARMAVCRMDVDDLGQAFVAGFEQPQARGEERWRYVSLARTAAFSRQMSLFFRRHINGLLAGEAGGRALAVTIVYSGGDDVFLVGAWNDAIEAAVRIRTAFGAFTCGALTLSAGIALFDPHHPIRLAAEETAALEEQAKARPGKDAAALFDPRQQAVYSWEVFERQVLGEKLALLRRFFAGEAQERGMAFLYRLLQLLRGADGQRIALARYAYLLARMQPPAGSKARDLYDTFAADMYRWALDEGDRGQLITAITIYVYENRKAGEHDVL